MRPVLCALLLLAGAAASAWADGTPAATAATRPAVPAPAGAAVARQPAVSASAAAAAPGTASKAAVTPTAGGSKAVGGAAAAGAAAAGAAAAPVDRPAPTNATAAAAAAAATALPVPAPAPAPAPTQSAGPAPKPSSVRASAFPAPHYTNYSLAASRDTFDICRNQSGLDHDISLEGLLPIYSLPDSLLQGRRVSAGQLAAAMRSASTGARLVTAPLGEAELSPALSPPGGRLPRLVHFTVRDKGGMLPHQALSIATWARLNPGYSILLYDDSDIAAFVTAYHPRLLPLFHRLSSQVERTDLWRYLVLCTYGGVYADSDVVAGRPISSWAQDAGLLTGVENVFETMAAARKRDYTRVMQIVQWTIAARPGHPVVCRMGDYIQRRLDAEAAGTVSEVDRDHAILERTGPGIWSSSVHDYLREHSVVPESLVGGGKVGDVRILPQSTFGCASNTVNLDDPMAYVYHMFKGSWRLHEPEKLWHAGWVYFTHFYSHLWGGGSAAPGSPAVAAPKPGDGPEAAAAAVEAAVGPEAQQQQQPLAGGSGNSSQTVEQRRLAGAMALQPLQQLQQQRAGGGAAPPRPALHLMPVASVLAVAALVCSAVVHRSGSGRCGSSSGGGGGRPCSGLRSSAGRALHGIWGGARRLASSGWRGSSGTLAAVSVGGGGGLLPLTGAPAGIKGSGAGSPSALERPLLGSADGASVVASTRQQTGGNCLKRSANSMQCLSSYAGLQ